MPKPQHVDDKLYDNILLLFLDGFYRTSVVFVPLSVRVSCAPKIIIEPALGREIKEEVHYHQLISVV